MCATNAGIRIASKLFHKEHIITVDRKRDVDTQSTQRLKEIQ